MAIGDGARLPQVENLCNVSTCMLVYACTYDIILCCTYDLTYYIVPCRPTPDEKLFRKPHNYMSLFHNEFLKKMCEESNLRGLTYHGGPLIQKCATLECPWRGVLSSISYPGETDYSTKVTCDKCNHEYDIDHLLKV